jgi:c(7)-type cytochrome triheme protein
MKYLATVLVGLLLVVALVALAADAPKTMVFESKMGNVTFDHAKHGERVKNDCKACHDKLFTQSKAPLNYKAAMHKTAEAAKTSCAGCHHAGGAAFEAKGNCNKCHVKAAKS